MRQLLEQLDVPAPVRLVGHDIGGMVAFSFARLHPERVAALALLDLAVPGLGLERAMDVAAGGLWHFGLFQQPDVPAMLVSGHEQEFFAWWLADQAGSPDAVPDESIEAYIGAYTGRERLAAGFGHYRTLLEDGRINRAWGRGRRDAGDAGARRRRRALSRIPARRGTERGRPPTSRGTSSPEPDTSSSRRGRRSPRTAPTVPRRPEVDDTGCEDSRRGCPARCPGYIAQEGQRT